MKELPPSKFHAYIIVIYSVCVYKNDDIMIKVSKTGRYLLKYIFFSSHPIYFIQPNNKSISHQKTENFTVTLQ